MHDIITALLNENVELPHFHFNESLFKPYENLLCLELCDVDVQDQVCVETLSSISLTDQLLMSQNFVLLVDLHDQHKKVY